jgi:hypothetical protein
MSTSESGASAPSGTSPSDFSEITVKRDGERPLGFSGKTLAKVSMQFGIAMDAATMTAAVYVTSGGKYISALSKVKTGIIPQILHEFTTEDSLVNQTHKAQVSSTLEEAAAWFKPGRLTDALWDKLGMNEPVRIE